MFTRLFSVNQSKADYIGGVFKDIPGQSAAHAADEYYQLNVGIVVQKPEDLNCFLTSSLRHPEIFVKEFFNGFVAFHDHCPGEKLSVEWQTDLYGRHCLSHSQHLVYA